MNNKFLNTVLNKIFKRLDLVTGQDFRNNFVVTLVTNFTSGSAKAWVIWKPWISEQKLPASLVGKKFFFLRFTTNFAAADFSVRNLNYCFNWRKTFRRFCMIRETIPSLWAKECYGFTTKSYLIITRNIQI